MSALDEAYARLVVALRAQADLADVLRLLEWDQETVMPAGAIDRRARQIGTIAALLHERQTAPEFLALVDELAAASSQLNPQQAVDVRETKWRVDRNRRLTAGLVRERSMLHAQARSVWTSARRNDDFAMLAPWLAKVVEVERRVAAAIDIGRGAYDVLLEEYEPGTSAAAISAVFGVLREALVPLVERLKARLDAAPLRTDALCGNFSIEAQRHFNHMVAGRLGFDFNKGRLDEAAHPFTTDVGDDVRITTRYDPHDLRYALYATIHETGHALYEQGLDRETWGLPRGQACSLGIHESQSRLWENRVARSAAFWKHFLPAACELYPCLAERSVEAIVLAANAARPSLIRTEADEITYNLHIILRFEIEQALVDGSLEVTALPQVWRERMRAYLGVEPETDRDGVLQDVHWPSGAIGYFPSYALGNMNAAQLAEAAEAEIGPIDAVVSAGEFGVLLGWLRSHVHQLGQTYRPAELMAVATGQPPSPYPLLRYIEGRVAFLESV